MAVFAFVLNTFTEQGLSDNITDDKTTRQTDPLKVVMGRRAAPPTKPFFTYLGRRANCNEL
jgi:hypothetical protein